MARTLTDPAPRTTVSGTVPAGIVGLGGALPDVVVTNDDWATTLDTSDEWITSRTGIRERRRAPASHATSDLAAQAARAALTDAGIAADELGAVVVATTSPDHLLPQTAPIVAATLGIEAPAFDLGAACSGFVYGLSVAAGLAVTMDVGPVLVVGAETLMRLIDPEDRTTAVLFGDGAGAVVVAAGAGRLGPFDLGSDGSQADALIIPAGGTRRPASDGTVADREHFIRMDGPRIYRHAITRMAASSAAVLDRAGLTAADIDLLVGHQANARILEGVSSRLGIPDDDAVVVVDRHGNTSAASIPLALDAARADGRLQDGARVLLTAFGAGLTWGSCLLTWEATS